MGILVVSNTYVTRNEPTVPMMIVERDATRSLIIDSKANEVYPFFPAPIPSINGYSSTTAHK